MALLNTHREVESLISAGVDKKMAEAILDLHIKNQDELSTKSDITLLRSEMNNIKIELKSEISEVRSEVKNLRTELKAEISEVRSDIRGLRGDSIWLKGILLIILGLVAKLAFFSKV